MSKISSEKNKSMNPKLENEIKNFTEGLARNLVVTVMQKTSGRKIKREELYKMLMRVQATCYVQIAEYIHNSHCEENYKDEEEMLGDLHTVGAWGYSFLKNKKYNEEIFLENYNKNKNRER